MFTRTIDQDNGVLLNAAREGLGYEIESEVIDMEPFYFEGINVEKKMNLKKTIRQLMSIMRQKRLSSYWLSAVLPSSCQARILLMKMMMN